MIYYARHLKGLEVPTMRTSVPYKTPNIRSPSGRFISSNCWYPKGYAYCKLEITLTWFLGLGWYFSVLFDSHWDMYTQGHAPCPPGRGIVELDRTRKESRHHWSKGKMLPFCAKAADDEAKFLVEARGLELPELAPYIYQKTYDDSFV